MATQTQRLQEMARGFLVSLQGKSRREYLLAAALAAALLVALLLIYQSLSRQDSEWGMAFLYLLCAGALGGRLVRIFK